MNDNERAAMLKMGAELFEAALDAFKTFGGLPNEREKLLMRVICQQMAALEAGRMGVEP